MAKRKKRAAGKASPNKKLAGDGQTSTRVIEAEGIHKNENEEPRPDETSDSTSSRLGLGRDEKSGKVIFFEHYRVIEKGMNSGYLEVKRGKSGALALIPPNGILRWPRDSEPLTKKQLDLMDDTKQALKALASSKRKGKK